MKKRRHPVWSRSVAVDALGVPRTSYGRADFIFELFMRGHSIQELCEGLADGCVPTEVVEDAIRHGLRPAKARGT